MDRRDLTASRREGRERATVRAMRVSILVVLGRSVKSTGERKREWMAEGRESRVEIWALEGGPSVGMRKVMSKLWWWTSRFANSMSGIRCPMPGLGRIAMCGGGGGVVVC